MTDYNENSCNALELLYYRPAEAAIRWCGLINHESMILEKIGKEAVPSRMQFPQWPCLEQNSQKILHAISEGKLPYSSLGKPVDKGVHVAPHKITVQHSDLKAWLSKAYPDQKPAFLFDEIERNSHPAINIDSFNAMNAALNAEESRNEKLNARIKEVEAENSDLKHQNTGLAKQVDKKIDESKTLALIKQLIELVEPDVDFSHPHSVHTILSRRLRHKTLAVSSNTLKEYISFF